GFLLTNWDGYYTDYHGIEFTASKRLANRWMARINVAINNAREHYDPQARYDTNGNPTRTVTEPLVDGGQFAPFSTGNSAGGVFNAMNANTVLIRNNNVLSTAFNTVGQNLSPRIFRVGVVVGF